jgi:uncharacterized membrane protein YeaQ/YmgE (transglycosylase-associated protein family)
VAKLRRDPRLRRDHLQPQHEEVLMDIITIIIDVIVGAIGGNATGAAAKQYSLGPAGNTIADVIGGVISRWIVAKLWRYCAAGPRRRCGGVLQVIMGLTKQQTSRA